jgi:hypothetical protein
VAEGASYRFEPVDDAGLLLGLGLRQLALLVGAVALALVVFVAAPGLAGLAAGSLLVVLALVVLVWPIAGRPAEAWAGVAQAFLRRRVSARRPGGHRLAPTGLAGAATRPTAPAGDGDPVPALAGVVIDELPADAGRPALGLVRDLRAGVVAAVIAVRGRAFCLLDPAEQERRLDGWGRALAGVGRPGSPVVRLQWIERAVPADPAGLLDHLDRGADPHAPGLGSHRALVSSAGPATTAHQTLMVIAVRDRRPTWPWLRAGAARPGRSEADPAQVLRREVELLVRSLADADLGADPALDRAGIVAAISCGLHPFGPPPGLGARPQSGAEEGWSALHLGGTCHATYWVAQWPRIDVGPSFLAPFLLAPGCRVVSLIMAPVPAERAARAVASARTAELADQQLRAQAGFVPTLHRQRRLEAVARREAELADGHVELRYSGYLTVSERTPELLGRACAALEQAAGASRLDVRRLHGQQADALAWTLPLGRGLSGR